jgi:hypothetical protein
MKSSGVAGSSRRMSSIPSNESEKDVHEKDQADVNKIENESPPSHSSNEEPVIEHKNSERRWPKILLHVVIVLLFTG